MTIRPGRYTARYSGPLVVFIIGMRVNRLLQFSKWRSVAGAMRPMIEELAADPDSGFLGCEVLRKDRRTTLLLQYWSDFERLEAYARDRDQRHWPAWTAFNKAIGDDGSVGIFHETYIVQPGGYETIYGNMPRFGLGKVAGLVPATGSRNEARSRMKATAG